MLAKIIPTNTKAWPLLQQHAETFKGINLRELFREDPERFAKYNIGLGDIIFDYSRNLHRAETLSLLLQFAQECKLGDAIRDMFEGDPINETEKRPVLHTALRNFKNKPVYAGGEDVMPGVRAVLRKMKSFCRAVHKGEHKGYNGKRIKYIVNIGIGGSDLGPAMVTEALKPYQLEGIECFFVSNVDGSHLAETLKKVKADRTLFLVVSKTFTTQETMTNARTARDWFLQKAKHDKHIARHFIAISTNQDEAIKFGISPKNIFGFWDWVGGRFSLWSAVGLSIALSIGYRRFEELLKGAEAADDHFYTAAFEKNIPVLMALLSAWYVNFMGAGSEAIIPYDQYLHRFPAYLQQAVMESNGKSTDRNGQAIDYATSPVIWGEPGTNGQHAFFQLLHQGTSLIPIDFIAAAQSHHNTGDHHTLLLSNVFAQAEALMNGKTEEEAGKEMAEAGMSSEEIARLLPYKIFAGNHPSNTFLIKKITPFNLGSLIAFYEHKIFVQGVIWNIYSFDQWGVELGKQLAGKILPELFAKGEVNSHDSSTNGLINAWKKMIL